MATVPAFYSTPRAAVVAISAANTARDGSGTIANILTAGAAGSKIERITIQATGTTTAGMVRLFLNNGTTSFLFREVPVSAITPGANTQAFRDEVDGSRPENEMLLPAGWSLRAATNNAEPFNIIAVGGDA